MAADLHPRLEMLERAAAPRLVPTPAEREADAAHARFVAQSVFTFGRQVRDFADLYPARYKDREDAQGARMFRRFMDQLGRLAKRFERLADMAERTRALPINRERLEAERQRIRGVVAELNAR